MSSSAIYCYIEQPYTGLYNRTAILIKVLQWHNHSPDLSLTERELCRDRLANLKELKQRCKEKWSKIDPHLCETLIESYRKRHYFQVAAKGRSTRCWMFCYVISGNFRACWPDVFSVLWCKKTPFVLIH